MFTVKFYRDGRARILEADSLTVIRDNGPAHAGSDDEFEVTLHRKSGDDVRYDVGECDKPSRPEGCPEKFHYAVVENMNGKTTEIIGHAGPRPMRARAA